MIGVIELLNDLKGMANECIPEDEGLYGYKLQIDKVIKEFEESKNRSCNNCKYDFCGCDIQDSLINSHGDNNFSNFWCNKWEAR